MIKTSYVNNYAQNNIRLVDEKRSLEFLINAIYAGLPFDTSEKIITYTPPTYVKDIKEEIKLEKILSIANEVLTTLNLVPSLKKNGDEHYFLGGGTALTYFLIDKQRYTERTTNDIDLFVKKEDTDKIINVLKTNGWKQYKNSEIGNIDIFDLNKGKVNKFRNIQGFNVLKQEFKIKNDNDLVENIDIFLYMMPIGYTSIIMPSKINEENFPISVQDKSFSLKIISGYNTSPIESLIHKMFRFKKRDKLDILALLNTPKFNISFLENILNSANKSLLETFVQKVIDPNTNKIIPRSGNILLQYYKSLQKEDRKRNTEYKKVKHETLNEYEDNLKITERSILINGFSKQADHFDLMLTSILGTTWQKEKNQRQ